MTTINLKEYYSWYTHDEYIEVSEEVAAELQADKRYESSYRRQAKRHNVADSVGNDKKLEYAVCFGEPTPEELLDRAELFYCLWNALNSLPETQGRRVDAHIILGISYRQMAKAEGVDWSSVRESVRTGLASMRKYFQENY